MAPLVWDRPGTRRFESGLDRGVLYLPNGSAVPWNGLTAIEEKTDKDAEPIYYDGMKIGESISFGHFAATMKAVTYPTEFELLEGNSYIRPGVMATYQQPEMFALCYRTRVGNDVEGDEACYKINVIYNVTAIPSDKTYNSASDDPEIVEFEWSITAIPEDIPGLRPTAQLIIDTRKIDPWLLEDIEKQLYGGLSAEASLMPMVDFVQFLKNWYQIEIIDNGDGTWTANEVRPGFIRFLNAEEDKFEIVKANAVYWDEYTFQVSDTSGTVARIVVIDNGDGTFTASTDDDNVIVMVEEDKFEIRSIDVVFAGPDMYRIQSQTSEH